MLNKMLSVRRFFLVALQQEIQQGFTNIQA